MARRILLVDDSSDLRSVLATSLLSAGHAVTTAGDLVEAVEKLAGELPELVMLDLDTLDIQPDAAIHRLHSTPAAATVPVVLVADREPRDLAAMARRAGATGAIVRARLPDEVEVWWEKLQRFLERTSAPEQPSASFVSMPPRPASAPPSAPPSPGSSAPRPASKPLSRPAGLGFEGVASAGGVLVVDDSPTQRFLLRDALEEAGVPVTCTGTVGGAVEILKKFKPRLILLDMNLPDMRGDAVCVRLKSSANFRDIRVLFISGEDDEVLQEATARAGADGYLRKPFGIRELMSELSSVTEAARAAPEQSWPLPVLIKALHDENPLARTRAARELGTRKETEGMVPLRSLLRDSVPEVVAETLWALGQMPDAMSLVDVVRLFETDGEVSRAPEVRLRAIEALEQIGGRPAIEVLGGFLGEDRPEEERLRALDALERIGDVTSREALQRVLFEDESPVVLRAREVLAAVTARGA